MFTAIDQCRFGAVVRWYENVSRLRSGRTFEWCLL